MTAVREPVSKVDNAWWHMDSPVNHMVVTSVLLFDEPLDHHAVIRLFEERMLPFERFRQHIVTPLRALGEPQWEVDPDFDIESHIHRVALPAPGDDEALRELVGDVMSTPLDPARPLWATWLVDGYGSGSAMISRIHHCVADGIALTRLLLSLTDEDPRDRSTEPEWWENKPRRMVGEPSHRGAVRGAAHLAAVAAREGLTSLRHPGHVRELARAGVDDLAALARVTFLPAEAETALRGRLGPRKVVAWSDNIPLAEVRRIAAAVNGTVNDVLVAAVTGAFRSYMVARGDDVPETLELHATVPVNLRPLDGPIALGNRFGLVYPALPVGVADPLQRLRKVKQNIDRIKGTPEALVAINVLDVLGHTPRAVEDVFLALFTSKSTTVLTNVPGPRHVRLFAGAPLRRVISWAPPSGSLAMSVSIFSYAGQITCTLATDANVVPDPEAIVSGIHAELHELGRAGARKASRSAARRAGTEARPPARAVRGDVDGRPSRAAARHTATAAQHDTAVRRRPQAVGVVDGHAGRRGGRGAGDRQR